MCLDSWNFEEETIDLAWSPKPNVKRFCIRATGGTGVNASGRVRPIQIYGKYKLRWCGVCVPSKWAKMKWTHVQLFMYRRFLHKQSIIVNSHVKIYSLDRRKVNHFPSPQRILWRMVNAAAIEIKMFGDDKWMDLDCIGPEMLCSLLCPQHQRTVHICIHK